MKIEREIRIGAPREAVWGLLWDVPRLARCIPGAREVREIEERKRYAAVIADRVGPFRVQFPVEIEVLEAEPPARLRARAGGRDAKVDGLVRVSLDVALAPVESGTMLTLVADIAVLGKLGSLGHGVIARKGAEVIDHFAGAVRAQLEGPVRG
jgi:carbon monoxide dehydrogenase subunit G